MVGLSAGSGVVAEVNASQSLALSVTINGQPVSDGTMVSLTVSSGNLSTSNPKTVNGVAQTLWLPTVAGTAQIQATASAQGVTGSTQASIFAIPPRAPVEILVPAYVYPSVGTMWITLANTAADYPQVPITVIVNPNNGEFAAEDKEFTLKAGAVAAKGGRLIAYVHSRVNVNGVSVLRPIDEVKTNIDAYLKFYPTLAFRGFFVDEMSSSASDLAYFQEIYRYIKSKSANLRIYGNPGVIPAPEYSAVADVLVVYEDSTGTALNHNYATEAAWLYTRQNSQNAVLPYNVGTCSAMQSALVSATSRAFNLGVVFITDRLTDPWGDLPSYWLKLVDGVMNLNLGTTLAPC
jgi:hypothetical protein